MFATGLTPAWLAACAAHRSSVRSARAWAAVRRAVHPSPFCLLVAQLPVGPEGVVARLDLGLGALEKSFRWRQTRRPQSVHLAHPGVELGLQLRRIIEERRNPPCLAEVDEGDPVTVTAPLSAALGSAVTAPLPSAVRAGNPSSVTVTIRDTTPSNRPLTVEASCDPCEVRPGGEVRLTAMASDPDPDGDPLTYRWSAPPCTASCASYWNPAGPSWDRTSPPSDRRTRSSGRKGAARRGRLRSSPSADARSPAQGLRLGGRAAEQPRFSAQRLE